jgi:hypothetical protein
VDWWTALSGQGDNDRRNLQPHTRQNKRAPAQTRALKQHKTGTRKMNTDTQSEGKPFVLDAETVKAIHAEMKRLKKEHDLDEQTCIEIDCFSSASHRVCVWKMDSDYKIKRGEGLDALDAITHFKSVWEGGNSERKNARIESLKKQLAELEASA